MRRILTAGWAGVLAMTLIGCDDDGGAAPDVPPAVDGAVDGAPTPDVTPAADQPAADGEPIPDADVGEPDVGEPDVGEPDAGAPIETEALAAALDAALAASPDGVDGMTLLVFDADDSRAIELTVGDFAPDRRIPVASASKMVSGLVFLKLVDEGTLALDSTPGTILGWDGPFADATLDMLNAFTSGMPGDALCTAALRQSLVQCAGSMVDLEPLGAPGTVYDYGSTHQHVAAAMAVTRSAEPWDALFRRTITVPLGIDDPALRYVTRPQMGTGETNPLIAGGLIATPEEYARILSLVFHRGRIDGEAYIDEALVDRMGENRYVDAAVETSPAQIYGYRYHYGFGTWLECDGPVASCHIVSSPGAFGFTPWVDWQAGYYAVLAMDNGVQGGARFGMATATTIKPLIVEALGR